VRSERGINDDDDDDDDDDDNNKLSTFNSKFIYFVHHKKSHSVCGYI
jgi:hypothetical protein